jgi:hypothetical protein
LPEGLDDEALEARLFPPATAELAKLRPVPEWREMHRELRSGKHVTLRLLWLEWKEGHPDGWGYSQFCAHYEQWLGCQEVVMRLSYPAGERTFVDFSQWSLATRSPAAWNVRASTPWTSSRARRPRSSAAAFLEWVIARARLGSMAPALTHGPSGASRCGSCPYPRRQ